MVVRKPLENDVGPRMPPGEHTDPSMQQRLLGNDSLWAHDPPESTCWEDPLTGREPPAALDPRFRGMPQALRTGYGDFNATDEDDEEHNVWDEARKEAADSSHRQSPAPDTLRHCAGTNPFRRKPVGRVHASSDSPPAPTVELQELPDPWADTALSRQSTSPRPEEEPANSSPALIYLQSEEGTAWGSGRPPRDEIAHGSLNAMPAELLDDQNVWDEADRAGNDRGKATPDSGSSGQDDWNLIDSDSSQGLSAEHKDFSQKRKEDKAPLSPVEQTTGTCWLPAGLTVDGTSEMYQVKNIRWYDHARLSKPRTSPILVQNANGPCPLVALVNALTLTTPADVDDTSLVHALRSREQVSLNLVLDAVFDELMSPRRTGSDCALPDIGHLYAFLQSLHTGMTVNPRFVPAPEVVKAYKASNLTHLPPEQREHIIPGTFENTAEMGLYATFSIPLIHGWLAPRSDPVYAAMERQAVSYEDAQNLLFREEDLEGKLSDPDVGLTEPEQQQYQDILTIKHFLSMSATQLTPYGINVIGKSMRPGTFAIFFRNDHFSTLYCHPNTNRLVTLVTDAGYRSHDEVVWETLVDINGEQSQFLSGEFRLVGGHGGSNRSSGLEAAQYSVDDGLNEWTTVQSKRGKTKQCQESQQQDEVHVGPNFEQEDHDLALALQLQEEEEQREREAEARRRRESRLSEQFIEQQGHHRPQPLNRGTTHGATRSTGGGTGGSADLVPGRRSSNSLTVPVTSNVSVTASAPTPPRRTAHPRATQGGRYVGSRFRTRQADDGSDDAPPAYEQAASEAVFEPPVGHPSHERSWQAGPASTSAVARSTPDRPEGAPPPMPTRSTGTVTPVTPGLGAQGRDKDCVVM